MYYDGLVSEIIKQKAVQAKATGRKFRLPKPVRPLTTKSLERQYFKELRKIVAELRGLTNEILIRIIPDVVQQAEALRPKSDTARTDEFAEEILEAMSMMRIQFLRRFTENEIETIVKRMAETTEAFNARQINKSLVRLLGVEIATAEPWLQQEINAFVRSNVKLIKSVPDQYFDSVEGIVMRGTQSGKLTPQITKEVQSRLGVSQNKARLIARDQVSKLNGNLTKLRHKEVGIDKYKWATSRDERVRTTHRANDGKLFAWDKPPATGHPGEDIQCRCVAIPVFPAP